jgi:hypothetical protein
MTTMPLVSAGGATPTLPEPATLLDNPAHAGDTLGAGSAALSGSHGGADALALFSAPHDLHPLAQQQQHQAYVAQGEHAAGAQAKSCKVPDATTRVYDVAHTSQADIDALKKSCDPKEQRLGHTIENVKAAYGDLLPKNPDDPKSKGARIVVTLNAGNGGEPVVTLMGQGFDPKLPARIHTHYHGDNATVGDPEGSKAGQNSRIRETVARDPQTVFVLPECGNATPTADSPKNDNSYHADWSNVKSQAKTNDDALKAAGITKVEKETVSVHSRGGEVILKLMHDDPSGHSLRANRLELYDSLYGSQGAVVAWGHTDNGKQVERVIYVHGSNGGIQGDGRDREIAKTFKGIYTHLDISRMPALNDKNNPVVYDGKDAKRDDHIHGPKGREGVRQFNPDPHYQTTGRFLAMWPLPN